MCVHGVCVCVRDSTDVLLEHTMAPVFVLLAVCVCSVELHACLFACAWEGLKVCGASVCWVFTCFA